MKRLFILNHQQARQNAHRAIDEAPDGYWVTVAEAKKRRIQEEKYHAMLDDISKQAKYAGQMWDEEDTKRLLIDEFAEAMREIGKPLHNDGRARLVPSENGKRVIQLGIQSRDFWISEASAFIEFLYAWGAERGVEWTEPEAQTA